MTLILLFDSWQIKRNRNLLETKTSFISSRLQFSCTSSAGPNLVSEKLFPDISILLWYQCESCDYFWQSVVKKVARRRGFSSEWFKAHRGTFQMCVCRSVILQNTVCHVVKWIPVQLDWFTNWSRSDACWFNIPIDLLSIAVLGAEC